jgi:WD40 repeat protein
VIETSEETVSVVDRTRPVKADAGVVDVHFIGDTAVFVLGEEALLLAGRDGEAQRIPVHGGAILAAACNGRRMVTGGDDGKVVNTAADGATSIVATDPKRRWIDRVALARDGAVAWSAGKQAFLRTEKGAERALDLSSTAGGLAFAPKGLRLAVAHYNGVTLWFPNVKAEPEALAWKGSHLDVTFSPDGRFLVTAMQESTLHGWRVADRHDMRMSGYSARVRSLDWTADGKWLATSGANQLILWPFQSKDGPMGKNPRLLAPMEALVEAVACHPAGEIVAVGYGDGMVLIVRLADAAEILARKPGPAPVTALRWNAAGTLLAFGTEDGDAGVIDLA